jgi:prevent-host-death family protein
MAHRVSIAHARDHLTGLIRDVERGKRVELTRRGRRVAVLVSADEYDRLHSSRPDPVAGLRAWREDLPEDFSGFGPEEVRALRDRTPGRDVRW